MDDKSGGYSETMDATAETQSICDELKDDVERRTQKTYVIYKALKYRQGGDTATTLLIKVHVGGDDHLHLKVFQKPAALLDLQEDHGEEDPIIPF